MNETTSMHKLHPHQVPYDTGMLDVGNDHTVYYEQCGQPDGLPIVFFHGGPGSGCSPRHRQLFDLSSYRVIFFDQRGCGRSLPLGSVHANTSEHLIADIEKLREHLGLERWLVVGGSWGAGLALAYAAAHPIACMGLVLRGVFLGRTSDVSWFFQHAGQLLPDAWAKLLQLAPAEARANVLHWLSTLVCSDQPQEALQAARAWEAWEMAVSQRKYVSTVASTPALLADDEALALVHKYRVQSHYLKHDCFWGDVGLLERAQTLAAVPTAIMHGRLDWICLSQSAWDLHQNLPGSRLQWLDGCGHSPFEPAMVKAMADAIAHYAIHGHFMTWGDDFSMMDKP